MLRSDSKLRSLLQLGQLIGLDLQLDEMLLQIARKATEVMEADRFSIFLYDAATNELFTTVALGLGRQVIRMSADSGIAGYCLKTGQTVILDDARKDPRLNRKAEAQTGYRTDTLLSMPFYSRGGLSLGVTQALNKTKGPFTDDDKTFLQMFNNHAAVFIEMAQLQRARIEALDQSRLELERLNRAKTKAINHISHELKTPIAVIGGCFRLIRQKLQASLPAADWQESVETLDRHLKRLAEVEREARQIFRLATEVEAEALTGEIKQLERRIDDFAQMPPQIRAQWDTVKGWVSRHLPSGEQPLRQIPLYSFIQRLIKKTETRAPHRDIHFEMEGDETLSLVMAADVLIEVVDGLIKNAVENTPDGGRIKIVLEQEERKVRVHVRDYGIGITEESRLSLFEGLSPARETDLYASKRPYDFGAGGKGLDLLRMKLYAERFGFSLHVESTRCSHVPTQQDLCPGKISLCRYCNIVDDCFASGGSLFTAVFPIGDQRRGGSDHVEVGV
jgi:signal transduction histidine kinase